MKCKLFETQQCVQDLIWAINSPSLIVPSAVLPQLSESMVDPVHLQAFLARDSTAKVGLYFERLILYWLKYIRGFELVAHAEAVRVDGKTLGELDFLFVDERGRLTHWEVAIKFYLYLPKEPWRGSRFVGPNSNDNFERKTRRLFEHQLPMSHQVRDDVEIREAVVKGSAFYPPESVSAPILPEFMSANHECGRWVHRSELHEVVDAKGAYQILSKPFWLSALTADENQATLLSRDEFVASVDRTLQEFDRPILAVRWENATGKSSSSSCFVHRFFIVPERWPDSGPAK
ncbi:MAG: DUF1853 family protein [Rhodopirellula sp. JB055]|uniref:DUF1853 family protein n=1 Tax=Rhodopirellula sp. JB055 TaxID=3342846 RepID=UPI00370B21B9